MQQQRTRPVFLNLLQIRLPPTAIVSILHRVTGVLLILSLPLLIYLFELSLRDSDSFNQALQLSSQPVVRLFLYMLLWALAHHFFAGIRYFLIDLEVISGKCATGLSASIVVAAGFIVPVIVVLGRLL